MRNFKWLMGLLLIVLLSGCSGGGAPEATATPTRTPMVAVTPSATFAPTATATPMPSPEPVVVAPQYTPPPPDVNPLTGLRVADPALLEQIPVAIKVSNSREARPQSGLGAADWVFEHLTEGGITRFTAVFYGQSPERVGSVRSGRLLDLEIPAMVGGVFAFSGGSGGVKERMRNSDLFPNRVMSPDFGMGQPYFYRVQLQPDLAFEHTLFTNPAVLRQLATERGVNQRPQFPVYPAFNETPPFISSTAVTYLEVNYLINYCTAEWTYNAASGLWQRAIAGQIHTDALTGEQITAANVVLVYANHVESEFWEEMIGDSSRWKRSLEIQAWGQGSALVFRDGQMYSVFWKREGRDHPLTFWDGTGQPFPLKPGNTWFQMVPLNTPVQELGAGRLQFTP